MNVSKQSDAHQQFFFPQQHTVDLTKQERKALSLVWKENAADEQKPGVTEVDTAHCAVLGYN